MGFPEFVVFRLRCATSGQHRIAGFVFGVVGFIHWRRMSANYFSNVIHDHHAAGLRVAFERDDELHRDAARDNASCGSNEAQTLITSQLVMFDALIAPVVAETNVDDADEEE